MKEFPRLREPAGNGHLRKTERGVGWAFAGRAELCGCSGGAVMKLEHEFLGRLGPKNYHPRVYYCQITSRCCLWLPQNHNLRPLGGENAG